MINFVINFLTQYYIPFIAVYVVCGVLYAVAKWTYLLFKLRAKVSDITDALLESKTGYRNKEDARHHIRSSYAMDIFGSSSYPPRAKDNRGNFMSWAVFWPINLVWTLVADVVREAFSFIYRKIADMLNAISTAILPK